MKDFLMWGLFLWSFMVTEECLFAQTRQAVASSSVKDLGTRCANGRGKNYGIVLENSSQELIRVCFDPEKEIAFYAYHKLQRTGSVNCNRPDFRSGPPGTYSVQPKVCYTKNSQQSLFKQGLIHNSHYFARGHLTPCADFSTQSEADATFYYINAVPQWQPFNNGNWKRLERAVRDHPDARYIDLEIWTGTLDILKLEDRNGNLDSAFLGRTEHKDVIPVPKIIWKVICNPSNKTDQVAVLGANGFPVEKTAFPTNICYKFDWLRSKIDTNDIYCCTVQDLQNLLGYRLQLPSGEEPCLS